MALLEHIFPSGKRGRIGALKGTSGSVLLLLTAGLERLLDPGIQRLRSAEVGLHGERPKARKSGRTPRREQELSALRICREVDLQRPLFLAPDIRKLPVAAFKSRVNP